MTKKKKQNSYHPFSLKLAEVQDDKGRVIRKAEERSFATAGELAAWFDKNQVIRKKKKKKFNKEEANNKPKTRFQKEKSKQQNKERQEKKKDEMYDTIYGGSSDYGREVVTNANNFEKIQKKRKFDDDKR